MGGASAGHVRIAAVRKAFRLEYLTLAWMVIEAVVAIGSGIAANSLVLLAFGVDSLIELASASVLVWRLTIELRLGQAFGEAAERLAAKIAGGLLLVLAFYVVLTAGWKLWTRQGAEFSLVGLVLTVLSIPVMYLLARGKLALAESLGSRAFKADALESITCGWLAFVVVATLLVQRVYGAWWLDAVASLGSVWFLLREGREALLDEACHRDHQ
jgi:divalent metal cation (Fe/Co/Zn/Cd) transporter